MQLGNSSDVINGMGTVRVGYETWFCGQNPQLTGEILFRPDVFVGHFQKLF